MTPDPIYQDHRSPPREVDDATLRAATIAAIWGTEDEDPTDAQWQAWCELVRRERVWRP